MARKRKVVEVNDLEESEVTPIRALQPGDILQIMQRFSKLQTDIESAAFSIYASFAEIGGPDMEEEAVKCRRTLELMAARLATLLNKLEASSAYASIRRKKALPIVTDDHHDRSGSEVSS